MEQAAAEAAADEEEGLFDGLHVPLPASIIGENTPTGKRTRGKGSPIWDLCKRLRPNVPQHLAERLAGKTHICMVPLDDDAGVCNHLFKLSKKNQNTEWSTSHAVGHYREMHPRTRRRVGRLCSGRTSD